MGFSLAPRAIQEGYRLEAFEAIGSTNAVALERAKAGERGPLWLVSAEQHSGRGRRGREWRTEPGNLAATLLVVGETELARAATLGFVAGLALTQALDAVIPDLRPRVGLDGGSIVGGGRFALKWPNDVVAEGAKLSGILLESAMLGERCHALAIGIGVNVVSHPEGLPYPATSLRTLGGNCDAEQVFTALSDAWSEAYSLWSSPGGLAETRRRWLARASGLGSQVAVRIGDRVMRGVFESIDEDFHFVVLNRDGVRERIAAGEVHFGAVASVPAA